jgi:hypothetical protein
MFARACGEANREDGTSGQERTAGPKQHKPTRRTAAIGAPEAWKHLLCQSLAKKPRKSRWGHVRAAVPCMGLRFHCERSNPERLPNGRGDRNGSERLDRSSNGCLDDEICHSDPNHTNAATSGAGAEYAALKKRFFTRLRKAPYPPDRSSRPSSHLALSKETQDEDGGYDDVMEGRYDHREAYRQVQICGIYRVPYHGVRPARHKSAYRRKNCKASSNITKRPC